MANGKAKKTINLSLNGRGIAIAVIAVISGACFALGYFVGQATTQNSAPEIVTIAPPGESEANAEEVPFPPETLTHENESAALSEEESAAEKIAQDIKPAVPERAVPHMTEAKKYTKAPVYSIQIAAFQNRRDAETMQRKFKSKGYITYILRTLTKDQKTIYKVRVGKFKNRDEAEQLALKLKEIEGVSPFITSL